MPQLHVLRPSYAPPAGSEVGNSSWCWLTGWPCWFNHPRKLLPVCQQLWRILFANCRWCRWWAHQRRFGGLHLITLKQFHIYSQLTHTMTVLLILTLLTSQAYQSASSLGNLINFHFHLHLHEITAWKVSRIEMFKSLGRGAVCYLLENFCLKSINTTDPRVEFILQVLTQILIKLHLQNLEQVSTSKSQPNMNISTKVKLQNIDQT